MSAECLMNYNSTAMSGRAGRNWYVDVRTRLQLIHNLMYHTHTQETAMTISSSWSSNVVEFDKKKLEEILNTEQRFKNVERSAVEIINALTISKILLKLIHGIDMNVQSFIYLQNIRSIFRGFFHSLLKIIHVNELMLMIGAETFSQSDGFWTESTTGRD